MRKELPIVSYNGSYGGNQAWFTKKWPQMSGCAATLASNLYCFYTQRDMSFTAYKNIMKIFFRIMLPGPLGFPYYRLFVRRFIKYMKKQGILLDYIKDTSKTSQESLEYVKERIESGNLVGILVLTHKEKELEEDTWHWMCITGYDDTKVILSSCGERMEVEASILFERHIKNHVYMISFKKTPA